MHVIEDGCFFPYISISNYVHVVNVMIISMDPFTLKALITTAVKQFQ